MLFGFFFLFSKFKVFPSWNISTLTLTMPITQLHNQTYCWRPSLKRFPCNIQTTGGRRDLGWIPGWVWVNNISDLHVALTVKEQCLLSDSWNTEMPQSNSVGFRMIKHMYCSLIKRHLKIKLTDLDKCVCSCLIQMILFYSHFMLLKRLQNKFSKIIACLPLHGNSIISLPWMLTS